MSEKVTVHWSQSRTLHIPAIGMLIPGANEVDAAAWDAATKRPADLASQLVAAGQLSVERKPATTVGRSEPDAIALVRSVNDIHRLELLRGAEARPSVLAAIGEQHRKLYVAPRVPGAPDPKAPPPAPVVPQAPPQVAAVPAVAPAAEKQAEKAVDEKPAHRSEEKAAEKPRSGR